MKQKFSELQEVYADAPISQREYEVDGKIFVVTRHFCGEKDIDQVIHEIATSRALEELTLNF